MKREQETAGLVKQHLGKVDSKPKRSLPDGIKTTRTADKIHVTRSMIPWLKKEGDIQLVQATLDTGETFYLGSVIKLTNGIQDAARELGSEASSRANTLFYKRIGEFIRWSYGAKKLRDQKSDCPVFSIGNTAGERVYFLRSSLRELSPLNGLTNQQNAESKPVILLTAVFHKSHQEKVLHQIIRKY